MTTTVETVGVRVPLCTVAELPLGMGRGFRLGDLDVAVFRTREEKLFAVDGNCPHKGGPLADGMIVGESVVCPLHNFRFAAENGACDQQGICAVAVYPIDVVNGQVFVTLP